uniref:HEAT repeat-containing protein 5B n=1 Tax=Ornithodoros turicata TaxID=34597 RepID=A0A2R5LHZ4_9ACAR
MELSHSLTLNEEVLAQLPKAKRPVFVYEWLRFLDKVLVAAQKGDIKQCQQQLVDQLVGQMREGCPGPPSRRLLGSCLATLFSVGDTFLLFDTINKCNDQLRGRDSSDAPGQLTARLAAMSCLGAMYLKLGRMVGRSYQDTVQLLLKSLKNSESQCRCETMLTMEQLLAGLGPSAGTLHRDVTKAARHCLVDRVMAVRCAAARCLLEVVRPASPPSLSPAELEALACVCFRAFEGSNYQVRCTVAHLLGTLLASLVAAPSQPQGGKNRLASLEEALGLLASGFLRGGMGFLKGSAGEMIKGASSVSREVRVGVTHAYVVLLQEMGGRSLERHLGTVLAHLLELSGHPRAVQTHVEAVYSRKRISFALRSLLGKMLSEKAQAQACKDLAQLVAKYINADSAAVESREGEASSVSQHAVVCALNEIGCLLETLGTTASTIITDPSVGLAETVCSVLVHGSSAARLSAAWCLRCLTCAVPSQLTPLLDRCTAQLEKLKASPEALMGHAAALAALLGAARHTPLGLPHNYGKMVFNIAEDLLRSATQNSRLSLQRTQSGWLMMGAVMTLGPPVVRSLLPRMMLLWKNSFPRSSKELEMEKVRGDAFTWQVTLEGRAGALSAMASFLRHCNQLASDEVVRRILSPIESALTMLTGISATLKLYGQHLKASVAMVRLRLYETMSLLPPQVYESSYNNLLRLLVAEFTLTENQANTTTSLLRSLCHSDDSVILGSWLQDTDHKAVEDQMEPNRKADKSFLQPNSASGSGALEHDWTVLYQSLPKGESLPGPLPLGVAVIDLSVQLYGRVFPHVANKHRLQMLGHFNECVKHTKATRQEAVQVNIFTALLSALKGLAETKSPLGGTDVRKAAVGLILGALSHSNPILRCAAGEALGRMAQVVGDAFFVAEMAQHSFDRLRTARDAVSRTGHSLALGCLHRYVGGMGSGQHLNTSVSILLALAQDMNAPAVQVWALHALALIADSGGPMFRSYVEPTLSLALKLLLNMPPSHVDVHQCVGKCLSAVLTTVGPELQGNSSSMSTARSSLLVACSIMQSHGDALVQTEAIACLQQLHMFAPRHVNLASLVPVLCAALGSSHLLLRRAATACLRQLSQREAKEVCQHARSPQEEDQSTAGSRGPGAPPLPWDGGLPAVLFALLDREEDPSLVSDIHDTLVGILQATIHEDLGMWLALCKDVLTAASTDSTGPQQTEDDEEEDEDEDAIRAGEEPSSHPAVGPRWPTRVFAAQCLHRIMTALASNTSADSCHFDLTRAREQRSLHPTDDFLVLHLSDLVRMAFMAATSDSDPLRLEGLKTLQLVIEQFSQVPEPEFPGHVILEQYQAQVGAALRPAFSPETPSHVTAVACQVCSAWIGSGVARDLNDLRRVHQLLVSSLTKLQKGANSQLYNESASTLEKLAILKAWAEVYIVAMGKEQEDGKESLLHLVAPELVSLSRYWLAALKDHALLTLPSEFASQLPHDGGAFYTSETLEWARPHYRDAWAPILHAACLWLCQGKGFDEGLHQEAPETALSAVRGASFLQLSSSPEDVGNHWFHLLFGICIEALCRPGKAAPDPSEECVCLQALNQLLDHTLPRTLLGQDLQLSVELCNLLHRTLLTRDTAQCQSMVMKIAKQVVIAWQESYTAEKKRKLRELGPANQEPAREAEAAVVAQTGEGSSTEGSLNPGQSVVYALLEVSLCLLVRHLPQLCPTLAAAIHRGTSKEPPQDQVLAQALEVLVELPSLCSSKGCIAVLPTLLFLTTGVLKEAIEQELNPAMSAALQGLRTLVSLPMSHNEELKRDWIALLRSTLARILDWSKSGKEMSSLLLAVGVFILHAPRDVISVPNLEYPSINLFRQALLSNYKVQLRCLQTLGSIFAHPDMSTPYIHSLGPKVAETLVECTQLLEEGKCSEEKEVLSVAQESLKVLDSLLWAAPPEGKSQMLLLYVSLLASLLLINEDGLKPSSRRQLHIEALGRLLRVGPQFPQEFRWAVGQRPQLRARLEAALRSSSRPQDGTTDGEQGRVPQAPSIKLKTDFSNFTG